ncbi:MAG TPA: nucleotide exchange factor GrpE [Bacteroidota bacterium]|nr:nucleotide exchange factor GrpE [Bacteroidota bacterium]
MSEHEQEIKQEEGTMPSQEPAPAIELSAATESSNQEDLQKQVDQYKDLLLRKAAEFDNFKRRTENEMAAMVKYAHEDVMEDLLPVLDDFERSLKHSRESKDYDALQKGIELIYQKLSKVLEKRGLKTFETVGKEFDVNLHDALMQLPNSDVPHQTILEEVQKGYMLNDKVIRHAKVVVSSATDQPSVDKFA